MLSVCQVLGTDELYNYLSKYGIELDPQLEGLVGRHARRPWNKFTNSENSHLVTPEGMDFLDKLLKYDHQVSLQLLILSIHTLVRQEQKTLLGAYSHILVVQSRITLN